MPDIFDQIQPDTEAPKDVFDRIAPALEKKSPYASDEMASKIIPQFTKGLYDSDLGMIAERIPKFMGGPLSQRRSALDENLNVGEAQALVPQPRGILPTAARFAGNIVPYAAMSEGFVGEASQIPRISKLVRASLGIGGYEGAKKFIQGKPKEATKAALIGAGTTYAGGKAFELAGKGIESGAKAFEKSGGVIINSLVKPLLKDFSYGKNPGQAVAKEGIIANSLDELGTKIGERRQEVGKEIKAVLSSPQNASKTVDISQAIDPIDSAIASAKKYPRTNDALITRLENTRKDLLGIVDDPKTGLSYPTKKLKDISLAEAAQLKTEIGDLTKWTGNASDDQLVNKTMKQVYGVVKQTINKAAPEIVPLNERYANLTSADIATKYRDKIVSRQNMLSLTGKLLGGTVFLNGIMHGDLNMIIAGASEPLIEKALASTALKTRLAATLSRVPASELENIVLKYPRLKDIPTVAGRLTASLSNPKRK